MDERDQQGEASDADVNARFDAIVSGISSEMAWTATPSELDDAAAAMAADQRTGAAESERPDGAATTVPNSFAAVDAETAERQRRRAVRKALRAEEVAAFEVDQARFQAEIESDDAHFVPPDPPPLPRPKRRTVVALLLIICGIALITDPGLVQAAPDVAMIVGLMTLIGGLTLLVLGLRKRSFDAESGDGWDDGARL